MGLSLQTFLKAGFMGITSMAASQDMNISQYNALDLVVYTLDLTVYALDLIVYALDLER